MTVRVHVVGTELPGTAFAGALTDDSGTPIDCTNVHVGVQKGREVEGLVPGDATEAVFDFPVEVRRGRFAGPYVHGRGDERFVYLSWGEVTDDGFRMFRRAKLQLDSLDPDACDGRTLEARLALRDGAGGPLCASVRPPRVSWTLR